ncbi:uncharacterized protein LOC106153464 [Lingula anatina]|uniref:Uncharacterized protein LOC106153464 n=1 Tax=Lingula anatina TaxID=7574 RepID=A0A1S3HA11_LINAN|nr:uncharacterized protein LOC106153464 [Lingula anatina]|eukprot:XP_013382857.1 uncharacterized protein LOC106153464 [Lingula anatina]
MKLVSLALLVAVGMVFNGQGFVALEPDQIIRSLIYGPTGLVGSPRYWKVMFALHSGISDNEWVVSKLAARDILAIFDAMPGPSSISLSRHRIGLVRFSTWAHVIIPLGTYIFYPANDAAIAAVPKGPGGGANINLALELCSGQLGFYGNRLVWMTTDGYYTNGIDPRPTASAMKQKGNIICIVVIGDDANMAVINGMASWIRVPPFFFGKCVLRYSTYADYRAATYAARRRLPPS